MTGPVRLQLSRKRGFDLQALSLATNGLPAVVVTRVAEWGNPFRVQRADFMASAHHPAKTEWWVETDPYAWRFPTKQEAVIAAVKLFSGNAGGPKNEKWRTRMRLALAGKNLACWCNLPAPGQPDICHATVLLELANK